MCVTLAAVEYGMLYGVGNTRKINKISPRLIRPCSYFQILVKIPITQQQFNHVVSHIPVPSLCLASTIRNEPSSPTCFRFHIPDGLLVGTQGLGVSVLITFLSASNLSPVHGKSPALGNSATRYALLIHRNWFPYHCFFYTISIFSWAKRYTVLHHTSVSVQTP